MSRKRKQRPGVAQQDPGGSPSAGTSSRQGKSAGSKQAPQHAASADSSLVAFWTKERIAWALALLLIYGTVATWGQFDYSDMVGYYNMLAEAFAKGQLHIDIRPDQVYLHDMIPYNGRYYLQWGPFPAVVHLAAQQVGFPLSDRVACILIGWLSALVFLQIISILGRWYFPGLPRGVYAWFFFAFALGTPLALIALRGTVYHESIGMAGLGVLCAFLAFLLYLSKPSWTYALACGLGIGIAAGSRVSLLTYGVGLGCALLAVQYFRRHALARAAGHVAAYCTPVLIAGVLLGAYNYSRFGSPLDYGQGYLPSTKTEGFAPFHIKRVPENFGHYFLAPIDFRDDFPWLAHEGWTPLVETTRAEDASSLLITSPFLLLALLCGSLWSSERPQELKVFVVTAAGSSALALAVMLCFAAAARRYAHDFIPPWMILAFVGLALHAQGTTLWRRWRGAAWTVLVFSVLLHMHLSFIQMFSWEPPDLNVIRTFLSVSPAARQYLPSGPVWDEHEARIQNDLGAFHLNNGRATEALPHFERAAELMPENEQIQRNLEMARQRAGARPSSRGP